jgi:two-component system, chemotaxis family, CheB/CheR fusion protein
LKEVPSTELDPGLSYCEICIEDNGIGIEPQQLDKIFDLFSRLNAREKYEGFGMGLPQAKRIVITIGASSASIPRWGKGRRFH